MTKQKKYFIGISLASAAQNDTGIAVLDKDLNTLRLDKIYQMSELELILENFANKSDSVICFNIPKTSEIPQSKWRIEAKYNHPLRLTPTNLVNEEWMERYSERGCDLCSKLIGAGFEVYRYNSYFSKNQLGLLPPVKIRSPHAGKFVQSILEYKYRVKGLPSSLLALSALDAIVGAYVSYSVSKGKYKQIGNYKNLSVVSVK